MNALHQSTKVNNLTIACQIQSMIYNKEQIQLNWFVSFIDSKRIASIVEWMDAIVIGKLDGVGDEKSFHFQSLFSQVCLLRLCQCHSPFLSFWRPFLAKWRKIQKVFTS